MFCWKFNLTCVVPAWQKITNLQLKVSEMFFSHLWLSLSVPSSLLHCRLTELRCFLFRYCCLLHSAAPRQNSVFFCGSSRIRTSWIKQPRKLHPERLHWNIKNIHTYISYSYKQGVFLNLRKDSRSDVSNVTHIQAERGKTKGIITDQK